MEGNVEFRGASLNCSAGTSVVVRELELLESSGDGKPFCWSPPALVEILSGVQQEQHSKACSVEKEGSSLAGVEEI